MIKNGQKTWIEIFPKKIDKWLMGTWKDIDIANLQGNANKKHNEISPHTYQNGHY